MDAKHTSGALNVATNAALEAGKLINRSISRLDRVKINRKDAGEVVSEVDVRAEQIIIEELGSKYPDFATIAEESGASGNESEYCWLIDPLDGTQNFVHGHPHCCVSIALRHQGEMLVAVVYDPFRNELFTARRGGGAQLDGRRIRVSQIGKLADSLICTDIPNRHASQARWMKNFAALTPRVQSIHRTGSSVLDLAYVAAGRYDGFWEYGMREWDTAAGILLVTEAGGLVSQIDPASKQSSGDLVAGTPRVHEKLAHLVGGKS